VEGVPEEATAAKRAELAADPVVAAKPPEIRDTILDGQLRKWHAEVVLLEQPFRDTDESVSQLITTAVATLGENIVVRRFERYALGEEL
jgi:elongation factor Ts